MKFIKMRKYKTYISTRSERNTSKQEYYITELNEKEQRHSPPYWSLFIAKFGNAVRTGF